MKKILAFLATKGAFLYEEYRCHIVQSEYSPSFGGTGSVILANDTLEVMLWLDRDRLFADVRARGRTSFGSWCSIDIIRTLLTGTHDDHALMDRKNIEFLRSRFLEIQSLFSAPHLTATESTCNELKRQRSRRIFRQPGSRK